MTQAVTAFTCPRCTYRCTDASAVMGSDVSAGGDAQRRELQVGIARGGEDDERCLRGSSEV